MGLRALTSTLIDRYKLARLAGQTFGGKRDLYEALGYSRELSFAEHRERYERGGIAARIVDAFPKATWRGGAEIVEDEDPDVSTEFEQAWQELDARLKIWARLQRADILSGLGRYSVLLIGGKGDISSELEKGKATDLLYLTPFAEEDAQIQSWEMDPTSERFGCPTMYLLRRVRAGMIAQESFGRPAHWTRIIHVADGLLEDDIFGQPRLNRVWNDIDNLEKIVGGGAESFWLRAHQGYQFNLDKDTILEPGSAEETALKNEVEEFVNGMRRFVRTRGMDMKTLGSDVANFGPHVDSLLTLIAGATGIPKRILMGSEMGQLASTQDRSNWRDQIQDRRTGWAGPEVVRPLVDRLIKYGYLPEPTEYDIAWPTIQFLDETERADVATKWANVNSSYGGEVVVTPNEIRDQLLGLEPLEVRQEALVQPAPSLEPAEPPEGMIVKKSEPVPVVEEDEDDDEDEEDDEKD